MSAPETVVVAAFEVRPRAERELRQLSAPETDVVAAVEVSPGHVKVPVIDALPFTVV